MIAAALREEAAQRHLPHSFISRLFLHLHNPQPSIHNPQHSLRKAAALWIAFGLGALAATLIGRAVLDGQATRIGDGRERSPGAPQEEIFDSTTGNQGENNMIMARKVAALAGAAVLTVSAPGAKLSSEPTFVFLRPETSSFWNTATNSTMTIPIDYPSGATKATLTVNGVDYRKVYPDLTGDSIEIDLPAPDSPKTENVYELSLTFDNGATPRTAKLGLIQGLDTGAKGSTRCIAPASGKVWEAAKYRAVLPIPYGTETFSVKLNGGEWRNVDTGLNGAQGWYALSPIAKGDSVSLSYIANGVSHFASLLGGGDGFFVILK